MLRIKIYLLTLLLAVFLQQNVIAKNSYFDEGEKLFNEKQYSKSKFKFEKDIVFNPKNKKSYLYLAKIFNEEKNDFMAQQNLETVILLDPQNEEALYLLALLQIKKSIYKIQKDILFVFTRTFLSIYSQYIFCYFLFSWIQIMQIINVIFLLSVIEVL